MSSLDNDGFGIYVSLYSWATKFVVVKPKMVKLFLSKGYHKATFTH